MAFTNKLYAKIVLRHSLFFSLLGELNIFLLLLGCSFLGSKINLEIVHAKNTLYENNIENMGKRF